MPIVPTVAIYDLVESARRRPAQPRRAAVGGGADEPFALGASAGRGATVEVARPRVAVPGGVGLAHARVDDAHVVALAVVNAVGDVLGADGRVIAGSTAPPDATTFPSPRPFEEEGNTTLALVVTDGRVDKLGCHLVAQSAHDGVARALHPSHTRFDGDFSVALATGAVDVHLDRLRATAIDVVAAAIRGAVTPG